MKKLVFAILAALFMLASGSFGIAAETKSDSVYYTRVGFYYENGTHKTTNYLLGTRVPINTEVEVLKKKACCILIRIVDGGAKVKVENVKEFSGEDIDGIFDRMFSRHATDLSEYSPGQVKLIMTGTFEPGMTKEQVIQSIGYPPKHRTPSLDSTSWRYWRNRFDTVSLYFKDGVLDHTLD